MLTIYCRNRLETQIERKREKNEDFLSFYLDDSDAGRKLELIHSSSCEDDRKL